MSGFGHSTQASERRVKVARCASIVILAAMALLTLGVLIEACISIFQ